MLICVTIRLECIIITFYNCLQRMFFVSCVFKRNIIKTNALIKPYGKVKVQRSIESDAKY